MLPAPDQPLENVATQNIFCTICDDVFLVTGNCDRKFQYCSRIYVRNWFTFKWTKSVAWLLRNQICEWTQSILERKKNPPTYRPIGEMEGRVREANIFLRVAQSLPLSWSTIDVKILNWKSPPTFFYKLLEIFLPTEQIYFLCFMT